MDEQFQQEFVTAIRSDLTSPFARIALISGPPEGVNAYHSDVAQVMRDVWKANEGTDPAEQWENAWDWLDWFAHRPSWWDTRWIAARMSGALEEIGPAQIAELRRWIKHAPDPEPESWTCDGCEQAGTCPYLFDWYNTNGDCIAEK